MNKTIFSYFIFYFNLIIFTFPQQNIKNPNLKLGIEVLAEKNFSILKDKNVGLITNITGVDSKLNSSIDIIASLPNVKLVALFGPEHGLKGGKMGAVEDSDLKNLKIFSLYGKTRRPTEEMLKGIDILIFDIQDIGVRSYTYISTMKYCMEESAKSNIKFIVLDRPNPLGGNLVDGPVLDINFMSFVGCAPIPYVYGMTIGEIALFLNEELNIKCNLEVIKMENYKRNMLWEDTGLIWTPTSPHIPEPDTPFFYPITGIIGELGIVSVGVGYTLPFKIIGAPWINGEKVAEILNNKKLNGVYFQPFYFTPFYGLFKDQECNGFRIIIKDKRNYKPVEICYHILEVLFNLYPEKFDFKKLPPSKIDMFDKVNGTDSVRIKIQNNEPAEEIINFYRKSLNEFIEKRKKYLLYE